MSIRYFLTAAGIAMAAMTPVLAQDDPPSDSVKERYEREAERYNAMKARYEAEQAAASARFAPLQALAGEGNVERGDGAGEIEATYLATVALQEAANLIHRSVENRSSTGKIILVEAEHPISLDALTAFRAETYGIKAHFERALAEAGSACGANGPNMVGAQLAPSALLPLIGAIGGLLRTDTAIQGVDAEVEGRMLRLAIAGQGPTLYLRPEALLAPEAGSGGEVDRTIRQLDQCRASAAAAMAGQTGNSSARKALRDRLKGAIDRYDAFVEALTSGDSGGAVRLAQVIRQAQLAQGGHPVLSVSVESSGGSLITRKNIWTAFGFPAVTTSGGVVVSYALSDPSTGLTAASGYFVCNSGQRDIRDAQRLAAIRPRCRPDAPNLAGPAPARVETGATGQGGPAASSGSQP